jgi:hypothetical protein
VTNGLGRAVLLGAALLAALLGVLFLKDCGGRRDDAPLLADSVRALSDSLARSDSAHRAREAELRRRAAIDSARAAAAESHAARLRQSARAEGVRADGLAAQAARALSLADSAVLWMRAYEARTVERDTLLVAMDSLGVALTAERASGVLLRAAADTASARVVALERSSRELRAAVAEAERRLARGDCQIPVLGVRCPSRRVVFVVGVGLGLAGGIALAR